MERPGPSTSPFASSPLPYEDAAQRESYTKRDGTTGACEGALYEIKFAAYCALIGLDQEHFLLASNLKDCGAFDDVVFQYKPKNDDNVITHFNQLKHSTEGKVLKPKDLIKKDGIPKYCSSYVIIKDKFANVEEECSLFTKGNLEYSNFIYYTTAQVEGFSLLSSSQNSIDLLRPSLNGKVYKLSKDDDIYKTVLEDKAKAQEGMLCSQNSDIAFLKKVVNETYKEGRENGIIRDASKRLDLKLKEQKKSYKDWDEQDLEEFFSKFKLFTEQLTQDKFDDLIIEKLNEHIGITNISVFYHFKTLIENWFLKDEAYFLTISEVKSILNEILSSIASMLTLL